MNMRRILKQPTLRMQAGGDNGYGDAKTAAFVAANPVPGTPPPAGAGRGNINPALVMPAAGAGRSNINPASVTPDAAPALSSPAQVMGGGSSFGDAASLRPGSAPTPFAQQSNLQQYASQDVAARGAGMAKTSGDWARTTPYMPPGVSPMPAAGANSAAAPTPRAAATPAKQGRSLAIPAGFESTFVPMAMPESTTPKLKNGGDLRTGMGGHVPGAGSGDKIDAKYEPGEFVVSNAMLASAPGLREQLHDLRGNVLASQGKTPEQADAKAVSGGSLRAQAGYSVVPYVNHVFGDNTTPSASSSRAVATTPYKPNFTMGGTPPAAAPASDFDAGKYTKPSVDPTTGRYTHEGVQAGAGGGQTARAGASVGVGAPAAGVQGAGAGTGGGGRTGVLGSVREGVNNLRTGLSAQPGPVSKSAFLAGKVLSKPLVGFAGRAAAGAGVVQNFNDYKLNDPGVDSSAAGTWDALLEGEFSKAGRSLRNGALEAGMDLGSYAANTADMLVPGTGPSRAYNTMLRNKFGDRLVDNSGNAASAPAQVAPKSATPGAGGATMPGQDPGRAAAAAPATKLGDLREIDEGAGTMQQFTKGPGGTVAGWTTVSTPAAKEARSLRDQQWQAEKEKNTANHFADMARQQAYFDGERQRAEDAKPTYINAYRARTERRGQDMSLRGQQLQADVSRENNRNTNSTTLRGQDLDMQGRRLTNESNKLRLQFDMGKDKRDFDEARGNKAFDQAIQGTEALHKKVLNSLPFVKGDKGPEPDAAGAAAYMNGANAAVARRANELRKAGRGAEAAQLEDQGVANISASDHQNLVDGIEMMKRFSEKNSEWFTSGTSGKMSNNPLDFLVVGPDPKNPKKVLLAGGQTMDMDDVAGMKLANRFGLPQTGNPQTDRFLPK